jgi:hypothetical protein
LSLLPNMQVAAMKRPAAYNVFNIEDILKFPQM